MDVDARITTPEIDDVTTIQLEDPGTYRVVAIGAGAITWRRRTAESPWVHGSVLLGAVKENPTVTLSILVEGDDQEDLMEKTSLLLRGFEQFSYRLRFAVENEAWEWVCQPADYQPDGGEFTSSHMREFVQIYTFSIPRDPIPVAGAF